MAIIFISIKKRQKRFFWAISALSLLAVVALSATVLLPELHGAPDVVVQEVFEAPDVKVNFDIIDSPQVINLEPFLPTAVEDNGNIGRENPFIQ